MLLVEEYAMQFFKCAVTEVSVFTLRMDWRLPALPTCKSHYTETQAYCARQTGRILEVKQNRKSTVPTR